MLARVPSDFGRYRNGGRPPPPAATPETIVVVGNGMVGFRFCQQLLIGDLERRYRLVVFGEEPRPAYDRVPLSTGFYGKDPEGLCLATAEWYEENGVELHVADPVVRIDRARRRVWSANGASIRYDRLVFATGGAPPVPSIEGSDLEGVFVYRTVDDLHRIRAYADTCRRVALIGGGLLGLEAAKALHDRGLETHVIEFAESLLVRQLNVVAAEDLRARIEELGVHVHLGRDTRGIEARGSERVLCFADGKSLAVDMVVFAIGIRPRDELAAACGLSCGIKGGIKVDERLRTEDARVHAIGECALLGGAFYGFVSPGYRMADVLAANLLGSDRTFDEFDTSTRLKIDGLEVNIVGDPWSAGESRSFRADGDYRQIVVSRGRLSGLTAVGAWPELGRLKDVCRSGRRLSRRQLARFDRSGTIWPDRNGLDVLSWPSGAVICECMGVTLGELREARGGSGVTVAELSAATGASTVCGSCRHLLARIAGDDSAAPASRERGLLVASVAAVAAGLTTVFAGPALRDGRGLRSRHALERRRLEADHRVRPRGRLRAQPAPLDPQAVETLLLREVSILARAARGTRGIDSGLPVPSHGIPPRRELQPRAHVDVPRARASRRRRRSGDRAREPLLSAPHARRAGPVHPRARLLLLASPRAHPLSHRIGLLLLNGAQHRPGAALLDLPLLKLGILITTMATATYLTIAFFRADRRVFLPGATSHGHYQIELACDSCHTPFAGDLQEACIRCHGEELERVKDSHPESKFVDPRNADLIERIDATRCVTCHEEHVPERTTEMAVTVPLDFCRDAWAAAYQSIADTMREGVEADATICRDAEQPSA